MSANREKLIAKIKALRSMTPERGCTEAEALVAAQKAAALMAEHALSEEQLEIVNESTDVKSSFRAARSRMWGYVAHVTNCSILQEKDADGYHLVYFGRDPGPEIACYLRDICDRAIDQAIAEFKETGFYKTRRAASTRRKAVEDFTIGMSNRLGTRLIDLFRPTIDRDEFHLARAARDNTVPNASPVSIKQRKTRFQEASWAGRGAAEKVNLSHGVGTKSGPLIQIVGEK